MAKSSVVAKLFWISIVIGGYPLAVLTEPWLGLHKKTEKALETVQYSVFANTTQKLKHDLDKSRTENILVYIQNGADINTQDSSGETALMEAIKMGDYELATVLISRGADVWVRSKGGSTALSYALRGNYRSRAEAPRPNPKRAQIALLLLEKGATVETPADGNCPPTLQGAVETGSIELVEKLLETGLSVNGNVETEQIAPNITVSCGAPPILSAAEMGDNAMVSYLISKGAKVNIADVWEQATPLMLAIRHNHSETAFLLLLKGADVNAQDSEGNSVLMLALRHRMNKEFIKALLKAGAKVNVTGNYGQTALTDAAGTGDFELVKLLIAAGAKIDQTSKSGQRMLWEAILSNSPEAVRYFIQQGADVNGISPRKTTMLFEAVDENDLQITKLLLEAGANPNTPVPHKGPPLFQAISKENPQLVKLLLDHGADIHASGEIQAGPIEAAVNLPKSKKALEVVALLIQRGADINQLDSYGNTALDVALSKQAALSRQGYNNKTLDDIIVLLEKNGAKTNR